MELGCEKCLYKTAEWNDGGWCYFFDHKPTGLAICAYLDERQVTINNKTLADSTPQENKGDS